MPVTIDGSNGITTPMYNGAISSNAVTPVIGMKNKIINGAMVIDQRRAGSSVTPTTDDTYTIDRWAAGINIASKFSVQQNAGSVTPPAGFRNYLGITSLSAYSVAAGDVAVLKQTIEGFNVADLDWGTSNAKTVTLSFWVRSSLTGTFGGTMMNSAQNRAYPFTYTISSANTWEQKSITVAGDTTGTWVTNNGAGIKLGFQLGVGSTFTGTAGSWSANNYWGATGGTNILGTNGATFYITGVQLEVGSTATSFDYRQYGTELALCQRYCFVHSAANGGAIFSVLGIGVNIGTTNPYVNYVLPVTMRSAPTLTWSGNFQDGVSGATGTSITSIANGSSPTQVNLNGTYSSGSGTSGAANLIRANNSTTFSAIFSAEL